MPRLGKLPAVAARLLVLVGGDPSSARAFPGSARSLVGARERRGAPHGAFNAHPWWADPWQPPFGRAGQLANRSPLRLLARLRWSRLAHAACSARAGALARG